ncbi:MAG: hypothetical protein LH618_13665 [Saprospiraceae bacterium]|nr:hypothetical protein [Saprospiraceae bacterium]
MVDFKEFPNRGHWICGQSGWEEIAGYAYDWMQARLMAPVGAKALVM